MDCSPPGSSVHGLLQAGILEGVAVSSPGHLPDPGIEPGCPALQADSLLSEPPEKGHLQKRRKPPREIFFTSCSRCRLSGALCSLPLPAACWACVWAPSPEMGAGQGWPWRTGRVRTSSRRSEHVLRADMLCGILQIVPYPDPPAEGPCPANGLPRPQPRLLPLEVYEGVGARGLWARGVAACPQTLLCGAQRQRDVPGSLFSFLAPAARELRLTLDASGRICSSTSFSALS